MISASSSSFQEMAVSDRMNSYERWRHNRRDMQVVTSLPWILLGLAAAGIVIGAILLKADHVGPSRRPDAPGWLLMIFGAGLTALIAALQLTGRLGPAQLWFRAPSFYVAVAMLLAVSVWWFRRRFVHEHAQLIRFGLPVMAVAAFGVIALVQRLDGRSTPMSAYMPTMRATAPEISSRIRRRHAQLSDFHGQVVLVNFWPRGACPAAARCRCCRRRNRSSGRTVSS